LPKIKNKKKKIENDELSPLTKKNRKNSMANSTPEKNKNSVVS
jgi:hypothetical protein